MPSTYPKHRCISRTFLLKSFVWNRGCGLSARRSVHHAVNLHKLTLFSENFTTLLKELLTSLMLPFLSRWTSLGSESPFRHKVVYSVNDGRSLWQRSIHHERENTMLFSSIRTVNGRPFLRRSVVWWQICWIDYQTLFEELVSENKCLFALRKHNLLCLVLKIYLFPVLHLLIKFLVTKLRTNRSIHQVTVSRSGVVFVCKLYSEMDGNEKYCINNARKRYKFMS